MTKTQFRVNLYLINASGGRHKTQVPKSVPHQSARRRPPWPAHLRSLDPADRRDRRVIFRDTGRAGEGTGQGSEARPSALRAPERAGVQPRRRQPGFHCSPRENVRWRLDGLRPRLEKQALSAREADGQAPHQEDLTPTRRQGATAPSG